ncbi:hypothetical protein EDB89DRAFT_388938 [Lactarius sanguifluus]|nr:hypothetical protein EDB89DRAFT_388938 [Lactarius sanguifluus]
MPAQNRSLYYHLIIKFGDRTQLRRSYHERQGGRILAIPVINVTSGGFDTPFYNNTSVLRFTALCHYDLPLCLPTLPAPSLDCRPNYSFGFLLTYRLTTCCQSSTHAADFVMSSLAAPPFNISYVPKSISLKTKLQISLSATVLLFYNITKLRGTISSSTSSLGFRLKRLRPLYPSRRIPHLQRGHEPFTVRIYRPIFKFRPVKCGSTLDPHLVGSSSPAL